MRQKLLAGAAFGLGAVLALGAPAFAQEVQEAGTSAPPPALTDADRIRQLEELVAQLAEQVQDLKTASNNQIQDLRTAQEAVSVKVDNGKPVIASGDGRFTFTPRAIVQFDSAQYLQDDAGPLGSDFRRGSFGDAAQASRARDLSDGSNFRRARIGFAGKAFGDFDYSVIYDLGGAGNAGGSTISEAYVQYSGFKPLRFRVGAFAPPTGLEDATSNTVALLLERASIAEIVRGIGGGDGRIGAGVYANGEKWFGSLVWTGNVVNTSNNGAQSSLVARASFNPLKGYDWVTHLGVHATHVFEPGDNGPDAAAGARYQFRLRDRPELRVDSTQLIDTGNINTDAVTAVGLELAAQWKSFYVAGEYERIEIDRRDAIGDPDFDGWYVQASWFPTGENRRYRADAGGFEGPSIAKPFSLSKKQWGALELALRYSVADLNYNAGAFGTAPAADAIRGGEQEIWTIGANWYLNNLLRFTAQYQDISVDRLSPGGTAFGAGTLTPAAGQQVGQDVQAFSVRTQFSF